MANSIESYGGLNGLRFAGKGATSRAQPNSSKKAGKLPRRRGEGYLPRLGRTGRWRRFDTSSSPSATRPSVQASASTNRPKNREQKWDFRGSWLYRRLAIFGTIGLEKAFFSKASYYVGLVRFRKVKRQRHNLK
jgi:hypothetical protein